MPGAAAPVLLEALEYVRATLKLRHLDEATDDEVEEALKYANGPRSSKGRRCDAGAARHHLSERTLDRTTSDDLNAPWSLRFDRDGTEDVAVILDAKRRRASPQPSLLAAGCRRSEPANACRHAAHPTPLRRSGN